MEKVTLYYLIKDAGDGSSYLDFYLSKEVADYAEEAGISNGAYTNGCGSINSYIGSTEYAEAIRNTEEIENDR